MASPRSLLPLRASLRRLCNRSNSHLFLVRDISSSIYWRDSHSAAASAGFCDDNVSLGRKRSHFSHRFPVAIGTGCGYFRSLSSGQENFFCSSSSPSSSSHEEEQEVREISLAIYTSLFLQYNHKLIHIQVHIYIHT